MKINNVRIEKIKGEPAVVKFSGEIEQSVLEENLNDAEHYGDILIKQIKDKLTQLVEVAE